MSELRLSEIAKLIESGKVDTALAIASKDLDINPWNRDQLCLTGEIARAANNLPLSLELYERAALLSVPSLDLLFLIGGMNLISGNEERGKFVLGEILRRDPNHSGALELLGLPNDGTEVAQEISRSRHIIVYPGATPEIIESDYKIYEEVGRLCNINVLPFAIPCEGGWWAFEKLDRAWREGYRPLLEAYERLARIITAQDLLVAAGGSMLHPEFIKSLPSYNIFICGDDPESSHVLSRPTAPSFDYSFTMNVACVEDYKAWGCKNADWIFCPPGEHFERSSPSEEEMINAPRENSTVLFCERVYGASDRAQRVERLISAFPQTVVRGKGWPGGFISTEEMIATYKNTKIGWNLHNSSGPTNSRTFALPTMGLLQICDNKDNLGKIFELDREAVGFDSVEECIDKTRYYLAHEAERKEIAYRGWIRAKRDYTVTKFYSTIHKKIAADVINKRSKYNQ